MAVTVDSIKATAQCPSSSAKVNQNLSIKGLHTITLKNDGSSDQVCNLKVSIETEGDHNANEEDVVVGAKSSKTWKYETPLLVSYGSAGTKRVTAKTEVSGSVSKATSGSCSVTVTA